METEKEKINLIVKTVVEEFRENLGDEYIDGIGIGGSFARGNYSTSRPDVNVLVFVKKDVADLYLRVASIFDRVSDEFKDEFNIRPRSEPERPTFSYKRNRDKKDIFFKLSYLQLALKDVPGFPFGRPSWVLESHGKSLKMIYGINHLEGIKVVCSNEQVLEGSIKQIRTWRDLLSYTPASYDLSKDLDLFFDESLAYGKLIVQQAAWLAGLLKGLDFSRKADRQEVLNAVFNKKELRSFLAVLGPSIADKVNTILDSRLHYHEWKFNLEKAKNLYRAAYGIGGELLDIAQRLQ